MPDEAIPQEKLDAVGALIVGVVSSMGIEASVSVEENARYYIFNIASPDAKLLIGERGANLLALQNLVQAAASRKLGVLQRFTLDVDGYKRQREWALRETAKAAMARVRQTGHPVALEPMQAYERRIVHAFLTEDAEFDTESVGSEPRRRVVVKLREKGELF
jgi:spoIIIJ-associated protein